MTVKERMLAFLHSHGANGSEQMGGLLFRVEDRLFYLQDDEDKDYFKLYLPSQIKITEKNLQKIYTSMSDVNKMVRVAKAFRAKEDEVWFGYQAYINDSTDFSNLAITAIGALQQADQVFVIRMQ